jgi:hypothetical protein
LKGTASMKGWWVDSRLLLDLRAGMSLCGVVIPGIVEDWAG